MRHLLYHYIYSQSVERKAKSRVNLKSHIDDAKGICKRCTISAVVSAYFDKEGHEIECL